MEDALKFIREYSLIYKTERYVSLVVSIITLIILLVFFGYQIFNPNKNANQTATIINSFVGIGSTSIITIAIGYIYKFMDKAMEAAKTFINNKNDENNGN